MNSQNIGLIPTSNLKEIISRLNFLRGLFAILVVIGHCGGILEKELPTYYLIHKFARQGGVLFLFCIWIVTYL